VALAERGFEVVGKGPRVRLVAFDLDGTLVRGNSVCEVLADKLGHLARMRELESIASQRRDRESIRLLRDEAARYYHAVTIAELRSHLCMLTLAPGAREGFDLLRRSGVTTAIVTITWAFAAEWVAQELGADHYAGTGLLDDGSVDHFWPEDKATWLEELMRRMGFRRDEAVAVGDSFLDAPMFSVVGQAIYVGSTVPLGVHAIHVPDGDIYQIARGIVGGPRA
jgi:HAD superfamily phosphoserine phosphatase-like hydrolase